jgi:hypothetical protein
MSSVPHPDVAVGLLPRQPLLRLPAPLPERALYLAEMSPQFAARHSVALLLVATACRDRTDLLKHEVEASAGRVRHPWPTPVMAWLIRRRDRRSLTLQRLRLDRETASSLPRGGAD